MGVLLGIGLFLLVIFIHELGHYIAARLTRIPVENFSIGFGRPIFMTRLLDLGSPEEGLWSYRWERYIIGQGDRLVVYTITLAAKHPLRLLLRPFAWIMGQTRWRIGWIPLGGFVDPKLSRERPRFWIDSFISLAGPFANLVFASFMFACALLAIRDDLSFLESFIDGWQVTGLLFDELWHVIIEIFTGASDPEIIGLVGGVAHVSHEVMNRDFTYIFQVAGALSFVIAFFNLLPIPPLDGGKCLFVWVRAFIPRFGTQLEACVTIVGLILIGLLFILGILSDIGLLIQ